MARIVNRRKFTKGKKLKKKGQHMMVDAMALPKWKKKKAHRKIKARKKP